MRSLADAVRAVNMAGLATVLSIFTACGGSDSDATPPNAKAESTLQGQPVADRSTALQIVARGIIAPLDFSELAHAVLVRSLAQHESGDESVVIDTQVADNAAGTLLRGEAGRVRAVLHFDHFAIGTAAQVDGAITLDVSRANAGSDSIRTSQADALSFSDERGTLNWSYLYAEVDAQGLKAFNVVSDVPIDGAGRVSIDTTLSSGRYAATGVLSSLNANVTLEVAADERWTIAVDNDKDGRVDFMVQAPSQPLVRGRAAPRPVIVPPSTGK